MMQQTIENVKNEAINEAILRKEQYDKFVLIQIEERQRSTKEFQAQ